MAVKGNKKTVLAPDQAFLDYEEEMIASHVYDGMPDLYYDDGRIQWETPSNRTGGKFRDSHDKRAKWWEQKAAEVGISTNENKWISKVAKKIHPTGKRPCKVCGRVMEIRYAYLSKNFINRVNKLDFFDPTMMELSETTHILDFIKEFSSYYGDKALLALPKLLKCKQCSAFPNFGADLNNWIKWIDEDYISREPSMLGPGAMSNPPDRLDGFHTYNRCCRPKADKGRTRENLASYSTDRRAFENWSDGNWITANKLMGYINSDSKMTKLPCARIKEPGEHPVPCSADHIGPISLGFCHRPEFQLLCSPCNSGKNNRMFFSDVQHLINIEQTGETIVTWYAKPIWDLCKAKVKDEADAKKLSRIMRDNRNIALLLLADIMNHGDFLFLFSMLNLQLADYDYEISDVKVDNHIVTAKFKQKRSDLRYVSIRKARKVRVAFDSLSGYESKENRNSFQLEDTSTINLKKDLFNILSRLPAEYSPLNKELHDLLKKSEVSESDIQSFLESTDYEAITKLPLFTDAKNKLLEIMRHTASVLANNWNDPRYSRD